MRGFISGLSILFHWSIFLSLCQYHIPYCLDDCGFVVELKSGRLIPPVPVFFLKIGLAIQGFLCFHTNCEIICSSSLKNTVGSLIRIASDLTSLAPHERLPEILVVPREKTPTGAAARGNP